MSSVRETALSMRLDQETKKRLAEFRLGERQVESGHYVRHEDMTAWLLSWGAANELPPPKCACGKRHDGEALCR